jgi:AraC family transcriptional regulator, regulatory protein of adaptative response / methylated-DNA-[protein]-cysteine methyltransferase
MTPFDTDDRRWKAVQERDPRAEISFFYAVRTTGIYCRVGCTSRLPKRENVAFYNTIAEAETAGYRPCKRCTPQADSLRSQQTEWVEQACRLIAEAETPPTLDELAASVGLSASHLHRLFKEVLGVTPRAYAAELRAGKVRDNLAQHSIGDDIAGTIFGAGYNSGSRFYEKSDDILGMTPTRYRDGAAGIHIRYALTGCFLGHMLVAATDRGLCAIMFSSEPDDLPKRLQERFPKAELHRAGADFMDWVSQVTAFIETPRQGLTLPFDIQGTAFQQRVWSALRTIPAGETRSYADVARQIGQPSAVRAVAGTCAANKLAVAIPCHRVVRSDGHLGGYRWGIERKETLLALETQQSQES